MILVPEWGGGWETSCWMWIMEMERGMRAYRNHSMMHGSMKHLEILGTFHLEEHWVAASDSWRDVKRNQRSNCQHSLDHGKCKRVPGKHLRLLYYTKAFDCVDHNKLWQILQETGIPDHLTCLLENLYAGQEATVRTGHGTTDWFRIGKGVRQGCILSPCLFNLYAEYIIWNVGLDEAQAGIKIARRNTSNLR